MCQLASESIRPTSPHVNAGAASQMPPDAVNEEAHLKNTRAVLCRIFRRVISRACEAVNDVTGHAVDVHCMSLGISEVKALVDFDATVPVAGQILLSKAKELCMSYEHKMEALTNHSISDPRETDLNHFRSSMIFESLTISNFTMVRKLSAGINGDIFKYTMLGDNQEQRPVAVKKLRNASLRALAGKANDERIVHMNLAQRRFSNEDALTEIGVLSHLRKQPDLPLYLPIMEGVYSQEGAPYTWLITEFAEGGDLFDVVSSGCLHEDRVRDYIWQLLHAVAYLHRHQIGHRDISLENILLKDGKIRLMDYGMAVRTHSSSGTPLRYYCEVGKSFYRAPECYVPTCKQVSVVAPAESQSGEIVMTRVESNFLCEVRLPQAVIPGAKCLADTWGYAAVPSDIFALGICMFILAFKFPPWECAKLNNRLFSQVHNDSKGLSGLLQAWGKQHVLPIEAMSLLTCMLQTDPVRRPGASDCLNYSWFEGMDRRPVEVHGGSHDN